MGAGDAGCATFLVVVHDIVNHGGRVGRKLLEPGKGLVDNGAPGLQICLPEMIFAKPTP
jgi:hypothetical protein